MKGVIVTGPYNEHLRDLIEEESYDVLVGADSGALVLTSLNISMDIAVGDFDSVTKDEFESIKHNAKEVRISNPIKDETDTHLAIQVLKENGCDEFVIIGGLGKRIDHTLSNMFLLTEDHVTIKDEYTKMYLLKPGEYHIKNNHKYISFFAIEEIIDLKLSGFKYELNNKTLPMYNPLCISNEGEGNVSFTKGTLLVIHQNE